ncbi:MAG: sodium:alanine symporter family protein [Synergistaceae bacterium]|nr:sodium:alanine symporter family protein [Synergistaceae bacterium]
MKWFWQLNSLLNSFVWGPWMLTLLVGTGIWLTCVLGFPQIRYFGLMFKEVLGNIRKKNSNKGNISSFAAMATALAATVGTGNIAGVATALHLGGPGALVWMVFSAIFGMTTKFSEIILSVHYREQDKDGNFRGGTMHILEKALGWKCLATIFAVLTILASFGIGNMVQSNSVAEGLSMGFNLPNLWTGIAIALLVGLVVWGGITSIASVTTYLVPIMALFYIVGSMIVVFMHLDVIPATLANVFKAAFSDPSALPGALAGWGVKVAITRGISRGVFSNEAGLGSAPMVHSAAQTDHPVRQGLYGLFEVFVDTIVICNLSALVVMLTGVLTSCPDLTGAQLVLIAFDTAFGDFGVYILAISISLFALSTILGWYWYAETALAYLFGNNKIVFSFFKILWCVLILCGAIGGGELLTNFWDLSDTLNGMMSIPNLICLLFLTAKVRSLVKDFDAKRKTGELL